MRTWTETHREGTDMGPIDWGHETAKDMPPEWKEAEQHPERFALYTGAFTLFDVLAVRMYDGWPYWTPRPAVLIVGPLGTGEWRWFDSHGIGPGSMVRKEAKP